MVLRRRKKSGGGVGERYEDEWLRETDEEKGPCFIATAAYGTPVAEEIDILRRFRDELLLHNYAGKAFVFFYYKVGPPIANFIRERNMLRELLRVFFIAPLVVLIRFLRGDGQNDRL